MVKIRYHLDESVSNNIARALRRVNIDVSVSLEADLIGKADTEQLAYCHASGRTLFTHDSDFLRLHAAGARHHGIVWCAPRSRTVGEIVRALMELAEMAEPEDLSQQVHYL